MKYNPNMKQLMAGADLAFSTLSQSDPFLDKLSFNKGWNEGRMKLIRELNDNSIKEVKTIQEFFKIEKVAFIRKRIAQQREYICFVQMQDYSPARKKELIDSAASIKENLSAELTELWENYKSVNQIDWSNYDHHTADLLGART